MGIVSSVIVGHQEISAIKHADNTHSKVKMKSVVEQERFYKLHFGVDLYSHRFYHEIPVGTENRSSICTATGFLYHASSC